MSSDDECDYMSDKFLEKCLPQDVRPGLAFSHSQQVSNTLQLKKKKQDEVNKLRYRPYRVVESEQREKGLSEAISEDNKGFALLKKMGYKPGAGIGKSKVGPPEPIPLEIKSDRGGLGRDAALKEIAAMRRRLAQQRAQSFNTEDYRARIMIKVAQKQVESDLSKSQRICEQLDNQRGFNEPVEVWFWPKKEMLQVADDEEGQSTLEKEIKAEESTDEESTECDEDIELEPNDMLEILTLYLRKTHYYCIWCGTVYNDESDMDNECPGNTRDCH